MNAARLIDLDHLDLYVCGDDALRDEILAIFEEQAEIWAGLLDPDAEDATWHAAAHALKGAARGVGAWQLGDLCAKAESLTGHIRNLRQKREAVLSAVRETGRATVDEIRILRDSPAA